MDRDDDLIRGIGYMVIQASHLEREIEDICCWLSMGCSRPPHHETKRVSEKIKWCKIKIRELKDERLQGLDRSLDKAKNLLERRNKLVHGQIYFAKDAPEKLIPGRKNEREKLIVPDEAYDLAEAMYNLHQAILSENAFKLVAALSGRMDA
ncbi:hypothetical protein [Vibrio quintilis]|uniref:Apea-like HEPN domain-containing protein n=1 Tax=Vibrio quintilis TaxID=1117707 RepID=A0A1M7YWM2_9VIBR|nr:hypothetical protein [Vibrio quintilis]SHO56982.1 hypothetical protein VQ7734_02751 [Vibrio quintilis]